MTTDTEATLLVAVGNTEIADRLMDTATDIAASRSLDIVITYVVEVPPQVPLSEGQALIEEETEDVLEHAESLVDPEVPVTSTIRYARDVATGIVGSADKHDAEMVLMGWRGRPPRHNIVLGSYIDTVLRNAPCDVLVKRIRTPQPDEVDSVLVPIAGGPHNEFATGVAGWIAQRHDATVTLLHVLPEDSSASDEEAAEAILEEAAEMLEGVSTDRKIHENDHVSGCITDETALHDVTVVGASEQSFLRRKLLGTVSEAVGRNAAGTVMIAQRNPSSATQVE